MNGAGKAAVLAAGQLSTAVCFGTCWPVVLCVVQQELCGVGQNLMAL